MCDSVLGNKFNTTNQAGKKIILTPSLFMRLLEWSKEDAKDDIALHQVFEKVMAFTDLGLNVELSFPLPKVSLFNSILSYLKKLLYPF